MSACPTEKQYLKLRVLANGSAGLSWRVRETAPLIRRGWATAELKDSYYQWVRITPDGLRALALAVEKFGLPDLGPQAYTTIRVCGDCGSERYRLKSIEAAA